MKRAVLVVALGLPFGGVYALPAGIPVFDATNIMVWTAELQKWKESLQFALETVDQLSETHEALVGITSLEDVITSPLLWQFMPENFMDVYEQGVEMGLDGLFTEALELYNTALDNDVCKRIKSPNAQKNCYGRQTGGYNLMATSKKVFKNAERRQEQIDRLKEEQKTIVLPKDRAAAAAATQGEMASAQVEMLTLQSMEMARMANEQMLEQTRSQEAYKVYDIDEPIVFDDYVPGSFSW